MSNLRTATDLNPENVLENWNLNEKFGKKKCVRDILRQNLWVLWSDLTKEKETDLTTNDDSFCLDEKKNV